MNKLAAVLIVGFAAAGAAHAETIYTGHYGDTFTLTYVYPATTTSTANTYDVILNVDESGFTPPNNATLDDSFLNAVAIDVSNDVTTADVSLISPPTPDSFTTLVVGTLNSNGCNASGANYICTEYNGTGGLAVGLGYTYTFEWQVTAPGGLSSPVLLKLLYEDGSGNYIGGGLGDSALSLTPAIAATPEPSTLALLGTGVLGAAGFIRRRMTVHA